MALFSHFTSVNVIFYLLVLRLKFDFIFPAWKLKLLWFKFYNNNFYLTVIFFPRIHRSCKTVCVSSSTRGDAKAAHGQVSIPHYNLRWEKPGIWGWTSQEGAGPPARGVVSHWPEGQPSWGADNRGSQACHVPIGCGYATGKEDSCAQTIGVQRRTRTQTETEGADGGVLVPV